MLTYPHINPIAISIGPLFGIGPLRVHWYGIMYLIGFVAAWWLARYRAKQPGSTWTALDIDDLIFYCSIGVIAGGRIGWCIFLRPRRHRRELAERLPYLGRRHVLSRRPDRRGGGGDGIRARQGQENCRRMRFSGTAAGHRSDGGPSRQLHQRRIVGQADRSAWGFGVPDATGALVARHPSQLYEATLEGLVLFSIVWWYTSRPRPRLAPTGLFFIIYGCGRFVVEWVRLPDANIGYLVGNWLTMGNAAHDADDFHRSGLDGVCLSPPSIERQSEHRRSVT